METAVHAQASALYSLKYSRKISKWNCMRLRKTDTKFQIHLVLEKKLSLFPFDFNIKTVW